MITWQQFVNLPVNKKLTLREQKTRFLLENTKFLNDLEAIEAMYGAAGAAGGFAGVASDGPIAGATVTAVGAGTATTDTAGRFTLPAIPTGEITVTGGTDSITGVAFTGELKGFPQYEVVSPMTTLAYHLKEEDTTLTADTAIDLLFASSSTLFGVELDLADKDAMLKKDYVAESILADNQAAVAAQSIATYLESVTEMVGSAVRSTSRDFTTNNAKVEGYKSIARQIKDTAGAKTEINPETLFDKVKLPNGNAWTTTGSLDTTARQTIKLSLDNVREQLGELSRSELYNANYLTTQIQAVNRGVKEDYAVQADRLAQGQSNSFKSISEVITESTGSLAQIEDGKANETDADTSKKPSNKFFQLGGMTYTMQAKGEDAVTLSFKSEPGQMFVVGTQIQKGQFLNNESGAFRPNEALNYVKTSQTIIATQTTASEEGKVYEVTLANPGFQVISSELKTPTKYLPTANSGYTMQEALPPKSALDPLQWNNSMVQPFTASISANQTSTSATVDSKLGQYTYEIAYNPSTSRYEFNLNSTLKSHIADFTNEAQWTNVSSKDPYLRFQIVNVDTHHIASTGTYQLSQNGGETVTMTNTAIKTGGRQLQYAPKESKVIIRLVPSDASAAPNGPFTLTNGLETLSTTAQFINNTLTVTSGKSSYVITYTT